MQHVQEGFTRSSFYSFSKLTIVQCLSRSSCSNTCKNPVIHTTSEYVESTNIDKIFFWSTGNQTYDIYERDKKQNEKKKPSHQKNVACNFFWLLQL